MSNNIGLFYASSTGNTEEAAKSIQEKMGEKVELHNVSSCDAATMAGYEHLIMGISTWGEGELQDDWESFFPNLDSIDFTGKTVALFGLGDQEEYCDNFLDAMGELYDKVTARGAEVVGGWPTEGYAFDESRAVRNEEFVGLALDEDNQSELSEERIARWTEQIAPYFK